MIRIVTCRLVIEKFDTHEKYHPKIISFNTQESYPLSNSPQASIKIISTTNAYTAETISNVEFDDIVRLQVSIQYSALEKYVWVDIFEGRVQNLSKNFSSSDEIELTCVGHIAEAYYTIFPSDATWTNTDARTVLSTICTGRLSRVIYSSSYADTGLTLPDYNAEAQQYISDVFEDMEKLSGYTRMINVRPIYLTNGNFDKAWLLWRLLPSQIATSYRIIEGTPRLLEASFDVIGDEVANYRYVYGATYQTTAGDPPVTTDHQYEGTSTDPSSISKFGNRYKTDTFNWVKSSSLCASIASGLVSDSKLPYVSGQVKLEGTPDAKVGDRVMVKIPSLEINNIMISGNYTVFRVTHDFSNQGYFTTLDLGRIKKNEYDYWQKNITKEVKTCKKCVKKCKTR